MRIVFIGAVEFSLKCLEQLVAMHADVAGVCTLEHSSFNADHCDLSGVSEANGIPWAYAPDINAQETIEWIAEKRPDVIFCFGWSRLLGKGLLELAPLGVVGYHPAALPANRGRHPIIWALVLGLKETASSFFFMDSAADAGDILSQERIEIVDADDAGTLYEKITAAALGQIRTFVPQLASGTFFRMKQDEREANSWRKRGMADGQIDWKMSAHCIHNLVRGLAKPYVGAHFYYQGREYRAWRTELVTDVPQNMEPGKIMGVGSRGVVVKCGEQAILLLHTEPVFIPLSGEYL